MMFYTSKLLSDATEKQDQAFTALGFSEPVLHALALADHFEKIQADEYVIPETAGFVRPLGTAKEVSTECYTAL